MAFIEWSELGIPDGFGPFRLLYNPASETVIAELRGIRNDNGPYHRICLRHRDAEEHRPIQEPDPDISQESAIISLTQPLMFFNTVKISRSETKVEGRHSFSGGWQATYSFDLDSQSLTRCLDTSNLRSGSSPAACFISNLLSVSEDGIGLYATVAIATKAPQGEQYKYYLSKIDLSSKRVEPVSLLRGAFF